MLDVGREVAIVGVAVGTGADRLLDEFFVAVDLQKVFGGPDPDLFAHVGMGDGIGLAAELHVMVGVDAGELPLGDFKRVLGKGLEGWLLTLKEHGLGAFTGGAVDALAVLVEGPVADRPVDFA